MTVLCIIKTKKRFHRLVVNQRQNSMQVALEIFNEDSGWTKIESSPHVRVIWDDVKLLIDHLERVYEQKVTEIVPYPEMSPATEDGIRQRLGLDNLWTDPEIDMSEIEPPTDK